ncbi:aldehyde dehydrogenase family protein [Micromonospora sp. 4G57]|uniref:Aldehyde dehydrogenase family protein n=1 Tax=Micromonospora sicca TaxID=2202420 RepID=A0ABU5JE39_9ACTN|nr:MULTISPECIES: aldehyde dehydrogenase family protein [unclassified Micromonospora]MDZ5445033.1 aldehyde dehydrogenase family protein [Micromonospora sp. 4G57]MDZ5490847.1 aldehyde dehydrogenase family protein [Micromonospora sp. 4G53]
MTRPQRGMLIDGELVMVLDGAVLPSESPATEEIIGELPDATAEDVDRAVRAARRASKEWSATAWSKRGAASYAADLRRSAARRRAEIVGSLLSART